MKFKEIRKDKLCRNELMNSIQDLKSYLNDLEKELENGFDLSEYDGIKISHRTSDFLINYGKCLEAQKRFL